MPKTSKVTPINEKGLIGYNQSYDYRYGGYEEIRTLDISGMNRPLYQLSYAAK